MPITTSSLNNRRVVLPNFDDGGLTAGSRDVHIYLPDKYEANADRYPVLYFNDGQAMLTRPDRNVLDVDRAYNRLIDDGLIEPAIFVGIASVQGEAGRIRDMTPTDVPGYAHVGGGLDNYYRFISERLKPHLDNQYRTKPEPASTGIAGYSVGGLSAFLMAFAHPETFGIAGCMSPSLYWDNGHALQRVSRDEAGKKPIRFWLDAGGGEYSVWSKAARVSDLLEEKGWSAGDDLAAYFDYPADHTLAAGGHRMREMLYFLLRKEPLCLTGYQLVYTANPTAERMDLGSGHRRLFGAEARYTNGFRLTVTQPGISVDDASIVAVDANDPILLHGVAPGEATISSIYRGHPASLPVRGYDPITSRRYLTCPPVSVGSKSTDPTELPNSIAADDGSTVALFGVSYDADHVHIAVHVWDHAMVILPVKMLWEQDSLWIRFDARSEEVLRKGDGYTHKDEFLYVGMGPGEQVDFYPTLDKWRDVLPVGIEAACVITSDGYTATLSVPVRYLDATQGDPWNVFRLNICINDYDMPGGRLTEIRWQPDWLAFASPIGSGIFQKSV